MKSMWESLAPRARAGLGAGAAAVALFMVVATWWALRPEYDVLFGQLSPRDAASVTAELDRMKVPYRVSADGTTILVDKASVPSTRLKVMSKDLTLQGAVGLELFNNTDFGMTEFAQKVNFQRALQGELTRTILSLKEVQSVRVHLALPEEHLFKRDDARAKASVTLTLKPGERLHPDQVTGIQRLIASAVPGIAAADVTLVDDHGVALSRNADDGADGSGGELKRDVEQALVRKAMAVLDRAIGPGRALASVEVTLDMNEVNTTQEDLTHPAPGEGEAAAGVLVKSRESIHDDGAAAGGVATRAGASDTVRENEYQVGRRVQRIVTHRGAVTRLQAVVVVPPGLPPSQMEALRTLVTVAIGAVPGRGDEVLVQASGIGPASASASDAGVGSPATASSAESAAPARDEAVPGGVPQVTARAAGVAPLAIALGLAVAIALLVLLMVGRKRSREAPATPMTPAQRELALQRLRSWLDTPADAHRPEGRGDVA